MAAVTVSVIYLPQALLGSLRTSLPDSHGSVGTIATAAQAGYAVGIFLLVPLADRVQPRLQIVVQLLLLAVALLATSALGSVVSASLGFLVVGLVANVPQLIIPMAVRVAPAGKAAMTTTVLVAAVFAGIFGGRVVAGLLGASVGWRWTVVVFAAVVMAMVPLALAVVPRAVPRGSTASYRALIWGTARRVFTSPTVRQSGLIQLCAFAAFNAVWTAMVLHLTSAPLSLSSFSASLFGLVGLGAGVAAPLAARYTGRLSHVAAAGIGGAVMLVAAASMVFDSSSLVVFAVSVLLFTAGNQMLQAANQHRALHAEGGPAAQANTVFMVMVFVGGSIGAAAGAAAFAHGGMSAVALTAVVLLALAAAAWVLARRRDSYDRVRDSVSSAKGDS